MTTRARRIAGATVAVVMLGTTTTFAVAAAEASGAQYGSPDLPPPRSGSW